MHSRRVAAVQVFRGRPSRKQELLGILQAPDTGGVQRGLCSQSRRHLPSVVTWPVKVSPWGANAVKGKRKLPDPSLPKQLILEIAAGRTVQRGENSGTWGWGSWARCSFHSVGPSVGQSFLIRLYWSLVDEQCCVSFCCTAK